MPGVSRTINHVWSLSSMAVEVLTALQAESQDLADRIVLPFSVIKEIRSLGIDIELEQE